MTEAIPIDVSAKFPVGLKPGTPNSPSSPGAPKPPDRGGTKGPGGEKSGEGEGPPPAPGSKTFLGWVASSVSRKQLTIAAAAACSLVAGIAAVRLIWPDEELPTTSATQPLVTEPAPETKPTLPGPVLTIDPPKPAEFIPPAGLPMSPASAAAFPPPSELDLRPPTTGGTVPAAAPIAPPALVPPVVPAGGTQPAAPTLPAIPPTTGGTVPAAPPVAPTLPALPGMPVAPMNLDSGPKPPPIPDSIDLSSSIPKPPAPIVGLPPTPSVGTLPATPPAPMDLTPGASGAKIEFVKPVDSTTVTPAAGTAGTARTPTTSYDVDIYHPKANDTWEAISREYYSDTKYASVLRAYNANRALTGGTVDVPPIHVLRRMAPATNTGVPGDRAVPPPADLWNAAGGGVGGGAKMYRVPNGDGMSLPAVAKLVLGNDQRWKELYDLNPDVNPSKVAGGTELKVPADARVQ